jgi:large subunit ribosomal protein L29
MKAKEREEKRNLSVSELEAELRGAREKQFKLRFKHKVTPLANPLELRNLRRHIARLQTWIREKSASAVKTEA